ncbi:MAG: hypothetical protein ACRDC6_25360 [Shewanella sp.]
MMQKSVFYPGIENLYGQTEHDPIKVFLVTRPFAYSALALAATDRNEIRDAVLNTLEGPNSDGFYTYQDGRKFANDVARGRIPVILNEGANIDGQEIVLVDIVTYPLWHCLITGLDPFAKGNGGLLWKVNHNILAPFIDVIRECGYAYTTIHMNEQPIDDAPTHNLIMFDLRNQTRQTSVAQAIRNLAAAIPNVNIVSQSNPVMDDRYCLNKRLPQDPPCGAMPVLERDNILLPE